MRNPFRGLILFQKPNGELGIRVRNPSAKIVKRFIPMPSVNRPAALVLGGAWFGATTWWFGEPEISDRPNPGGQSATEISVTKLEVN